MEFSNLNDTYNEKDRPRFLTEEEINVILDVLPTTYSADEYEGKMIREAIQKDLRDKLMDKKLAPSAINNIANDIVKHYTTSRIAAGLSVGAHAAESSAHAPMQAALNSIAPYDKIILQDLKGHGFVTEIGPWIDQLLDNNKDKIQLIPKNETELLELDKPVFISSCNEDGKVTWNHVSHITRHLPKGDLVKIKTKSGREVTATQSKSLLKWDEVTNKIVSVKGKNIKVGDLVPITNQLPDPPKVYDELDLKKYLSPQEWIYMSEMQNVYESYSNKTKRNFWSVKNYLENVPYNRGDSFLEGVKDMQQKEMFNNGCVYPKSWGQASKSRIPEKIKLDRKFGQFVGLYLADGCVSDTFVSMTKDEPSVLSLIYDFCDDFHLGHHTVHTECDMGKKVTTFIHSVLFARLFKVWLKSGSKKKIMPEEILFGNKEFVKGVLDGYFAGDGSVSKRDGRMVITSVSKTLIDGFGYLCSRVDIFGKKSGRQSLKNNLNTKNILYTYEFSISNLNVDKWRDVIGCCNKQKWKKMNKQYPRTVGWGKGYKKHNNVMLDPIVSIDYVKDIKYVYDLTVPDTLHFNLYNGLACDDSFHSSGQSKSGSSGINGIEELLYLKKNRKYEICTVHYKNKSLTYEEVLETKKDIIGCTVIELIQDELYIKEGKNYVKNITIDFYGNLKKYWFHDEEYIKNILETEAPPDDAYVLRIKLNLYQLYIYKITIEDIINTFKRELDSPIRLIYGSMLDGIIDIYACSDYDKKQKLVSVECEATNNPVISAAYYQTIIIPSFDTLRIKGVQGITNLTPIIAPVVSIIINDDEQYFYLTTSINIKNLLILFNLVGIKVLRYHNDYFLKLPAYDNQRLSLSKSAYDLLTPLTFIEGLIGDEVSPKVEKELSTLKKFKITPVYLITLSPKHIKKNGVDKNKLLELLTTINVKVIREEEYKLYIDKKEVRKTINQLIDENPLIRKAAEVIYAEVSGTNLRGLLALDIVDQQRTISNNIHVIAQVLGIRAARAYFIEDLYNIMSSYSLHPQHVLTIADVYFHRGVPSGAQNLSVNKNLGPIDKASVAKPADVFKSSAILGINHEITGVASNIIFGLPPKVGTGYFDVGYENKKLLLNTDIYKQFKKLDKKILNQMDEIEETDDPLIAPTLLVGKTVSVKPTVVTAAPIVSRFQRTIIDKDKTEKKRGKK